MKCTRVVEAKKEPSLDVAYIFKQCFNCTECAFEKESKSKYNSLSAKHRDQ